MQDEQTLLGWMFKNNINLQWHLHPKTQISKRK